MSLLPGYVQKFCDGRVRIDELFVSTSTSASTSTCNTQKGC